jgi:hypothetical protein
MNQAKIHHARKSMKSQPANAAGMMICGEKDFPGQENRGRVPVGCGMLSF